MKFRWNYVKLTDFDRVVDRIGMACFAFFPILKLFKTMNIDLIHIFIYSKQTYVNIIC